MGDEILMERHGGTVVLRLHRPQRRNAVNAALAASMRQALRDVAADATARLVILTGNEACFCAGMDLGAYLDGEGPAINDGEGRFAGVTGHVLPVPVLAAVEGPALGGGLELALACDGIVAGESAVFGAPEVRVGLFAAAGGAFRLPGRIPPARALELLLTGERFTARQAEAWGLVNRVVPDGQALAAALELGERLTAAAPLALRATLELVRARRDRDEAALWERNDRLWQEIQSSQDAAEGPRAFLEKRAPVWTGE